MVDTPKLKVAASRDCTGHVHEVPPCSRLEQKRWPTTAHGLLGLAWTGESTEHSLPLRHGIFGAGPGGQPVRVEGLRSRSCPQAAVFWEEPRPPSSSPGAGWESGLAKENFPVSGGKGKGAPAAERTRGLTWRRRAGGPGWTRARRTLQLGGQQVPPQLRGGRAPWRAWAPHPAGPPPFHTNLFLPTGTSLKPNARELLEQGMVTSKGSRG